MPLPLAPAVDIVLPLSFICDGAGTSHCNVADMLATLRQRIQAISLTYVIHPEKFPKPLSFKHVCPYSSCQLPVSQPAIAGGMYLAFIGKYLSSLRKLDYVLVRKEGLKTQL